jgi:hypothetical protein
MIQSSALFVTAGCHFASRGRPLTISAEGKSYVLPPVNVPRWRARFQKIC